MRRWLAALVGLCLGALAASDAPAQQRETRIALIIANTDYVSGQLIDLPGAQRDASAISAALERAGFSRQDIVIERNLDIAGMRRAFSSFGARLAALGQSGLGFIYYAGHGIADSDGEGARNYIIPTDANLNSAFDYPNAAYSVSSLLDGLNRTRARTVVVVLDACRRTPLRGDRGMVPEIVPRNMLVAYSASPGQAASDDGTYARRLAEELVRPNADITQVFTQVQYLVSADSRGSQTPRVDIGLTAPVVFVAASAPASVAPATTPPRVTAPPTVVASTMRRPGDVFRDCPDCPEMVVIPAGSFMMGSPANEAGRGTDEGPQHRVTIRQFAVSRYEVTRGQYAAFVRSSGYATGANCYTDRARRGNWAQDPNGTWRDPSFTQSDEHPVVCVSWEDAQAFVRWLNTQTAASATMVSDGGASSAYRLLSEAEWEYAARAGSTSAYPWGGDVNQGCAYANGADTTARARFPSWTTMTCNDGALNTAAVGAHQPNRFGLYDMIGNAWEWVEDCYVETYAGAPTDGTAQTSGACSLRVVRGGSWDYDPQGIRSANRNRGVSTVRFYVDGFRLARTL